MGENSTPSFSWEEKREEEKFNLADYAVNCLCIVSLLLNLFIVVQSLRDVGLRRCRRLNILITNLSVACGIHVIIGAIFFSEEDKIINEIALCSFISFAHCFLPNVISLTVMAISYDRMRNLKRSGRKWSLVQLFGLIWLISFFGSVATIITSKLDPQSGKCFQEHLFGSQTLTIVFEVGRCLIFHVLVSLYLMFEMTNVRRKIKYLEKFKVEQTWILFKNVQRIRFMYMTFLAFILLWLPFGILSAFYNSTTSSSSFVNIMAYLYILILPLTIFYTNESPVARNGFRLRRRISINKSSTNVSKSINFELSREAPLFSNSLLHTRGLSTSQPIKGNYVDQKRIVKKVVSLEAGLDKKGIEPFKL